jgi:hypothetical protein
MLGTTKDPGYHSVIRCDDSAAMQGKDDPRDQLHGIKLYILNPKDNAGLPELVRDTDGR